MELSHGQKIQKIKVQDLSSLFMTHRLNMMHVPVKLHEYIPYGLGVMAQIHYLLYGTKSREIIQKPKMHDFSSLFMTLRLNVMHASVKFRDYIPYGFGVMARTRYGTDRRTDERTGRTG